MPGQVEQLRAAFADPAVWSRSEPAAREFIARYSFSVAPTVAELEDLKSSLTAERGFLLGLLENPDLLERETFTDLLLAVFHLTEELTHRHKVAELPAADQAHLAGDVRRIYGLLVHQWLDHLHYLKRDYPYLFSLAIRTNPFDEKASPVVTG